MSVTHVAGPVVTIRSLNRSIQRCAICGEKLRDNLNEMGPIGPDGKPPAFLHYSEAALIEIDGNRTSVVGDFLDCDRLPDDFCLSLVE